MFNEEVCTCLKENLVYQSFALRIIVLTILTVI